MATNTSFQGLVKPSLSEAVNVADVNSNMDKIDAAIGQRSRVQDLVINGDFMPGYIVNQRGGSSYPGIKYGVDMWKGTTSLSTISVTSDGLSIIHGGTSGYAIAMQRFPNHIYSAYKNSVLTVAACLSDGTVAAKSGIPSNGSFNASFGNGFSAQLYAPSGETYIGVRLMNGTPGSTVTVRWVSVYPGAFTADNLPSHQPRGYAAELAECKRYFRKYAGLLLPGGTHNVTTFVGALDMYDMRITPSIEALNVSWVKAGGVYKAMSVTAVVGTLGRINMTLGEELPAHEGGMAYLNNLELSAEL